MGDSQEMSLNILFITQDDPFYVRLFFEEFFKAYQPLKEINGVVIGRTLGSRSPFALIRRMWGFYGPRDFFRVGMRYSALKTLGAIEESLRRTSSTGLASLCRSYGVTVLHEADINGKPFLDKVRGMGPDLILSVAASVIFKEELLGLAKHGCLNIHNGRLPRYRGMMPVFWQLYHDEERIVVTVHEMNVKIDDGRILLQREVVVETGESLDSLMRRLKKVAAHMMIEVIGQVKRGEVIYKDNPIAESSYFTFPSREDVRQFRRMGKKIL
jgi:methionyl-tRNA formyltransferase